MLVLEDNLLETCIPNLKDETPSALLHPEEKVLYETRRFMPIKPRDNSLLGSMYRHDGEYRLVRRKRQAHGLSLTADVNPTVSTIDDSRDQEQFSDAVAPNPQSTVVLTIRE